MASRTTGRSRRGGAEPAPSRREPHLGGELRRLARSTQQLELAALSESEVTRSQVHTLLAIHQMARPSMAMLAREMELAPSTVTRLVDPLVRHGLVERQPDPEDRRVVAIMLTAAGKRALRKVEQQLQHAYAQVAAEIPRSEQAHLGEALSTLGRAIERARLRLA